MTTDVRSHIHVYVVDGNTHHIQLKINNLNFVYLQSCVRFVWLKDSLVSLCTVNTDYITEETLRDIQVHVL